MSQARRAFWKGRLSREQEETFVEELPDPDLWDAQQSADTTLLAPPVAKPVNAQGMTSDEVLATSNERFGYSKEEVGYAEAPQAAMTCATCRFFLRTRGSEVGQCEAVNGDIPWRGSCGLHISMMEEAKAILGG